MKGILISDIEAFSCDEQLSLLSSMANLKASKAYQRTTSYHDAWGTPSSDYCP